MARPVIERIDKSSDTFETGAIKVIGQNFQSALTLLLVNGSSAKITSITDTEIVGVIPQVPKTGIYDVKVMTRGLTRAPKNEFSNGLPTRIFKISLNDLDQRTLPTLEEVAIEIEEDIEDIIGDSSSSISSDSSTSSTSSSISTDSESTESSNSVSSQSTESTDSSSTEAGSSQSSLSDDSSVTSSSTAPSDLSSLSSSYTSGSTPSDASSVSSTSTSESTISGTSSSTSSISSDSTSSPADDSSSTSSQPSTSSSSSSISTLSSSSSSTSTSDSTPSEDSSESTDLSSSSSSSSESSDISSSSSPFESSSSAENPVSLTYVGSQNFSGTTATLVNIGTPNPLRLVFVVLAEVTSVTTELTINDIECRRIVGQTQAAVTSAIFVARVPEGTTATIIKGPASTNSEIGIYTANSSEYPFLLDVDTDTDFNTQPLNLSVNAQPFGKVLTIGGVQNGSSSTLTGVDTVDFDGDINTNEFFAFGNTSETSGIQNISYSGFGNNNASAVAATFVLQGAAAYQKEGNLSYAGFKTTSGTVASSFALPPEDPDRVVFITIAEIDGSSPNITSVTIGGFAATQIISDGTTNCFASIWAAKVPTGGEVDVVISAGNIVARIDMYTGYTTDSIATIISNSFTDSGADSSAINLSVNPGAVSDVIAVCTSVNSSSVAVSGIDTEVFNGDINTTEFTSAGYSKGAAGLQNIDYTITGSVDTAAVAMAVIMNLDDDSSSSSSESSSSGVLAAGWESPEVISTAVFAPLGFNFDDADGSLAAGVSAGDRLVVYDGVSAGTYTVVSATWDTIFNTLVQTVEPPVVGSPQGIAKLYNDQYSSSTSSAP